MILKGMNQNMRYMLERATPESVGIPSEKITAMLTELKKAGLSMHSVMLVRHGKVFAEGYADYFDADYKHRMYYLFIRHFSYPPFLYGAKP